MKKINVLSLTSILPIPGIRKINDFLIPLYQEYLKITPDSKVVFLLPRTFYPFSIKRIKVLKIKKFNLEGFPVFIFPYLSFQKLRNLHALLCYTLFLFNRKAIKKLIRDEEIDIIHAEFIFPDGLLAYLLKKKMGIPYLVTTHNESRYFNRLISRKLSTKILKNADKVTPLNYYQKELYERYGIKSPLVVAHGIDEVFINKKPVEHNSDNVKLITIAALIKLKNIDKILHALGKLKDKYDFTYTVIGSGPEKEFLLHLAKEYQINERVEFIDRVPYDEIPEMLSRHEIFVMPSYFESFGRVFFEAMAVGLPIICAKNTGVHKYFTEMKEGVSVDHTNIDELTEKLELLISDKKLRNKMSENAARFAGNFSWNDIAKQFYNLYHQSFYKE